MRDSGKRLVAAAAAVANKMCVYASEMDDDEREHLSGFFFVVL